MSQLIYFMQRMEFLKIFIVFVLWTVFGSFWWVLIGRSWDKDWIKSILFWRSKCDKCWKTLSALELIPLVSFFVQGWKCKKCWTKLSNFYRIIELIIWIVFVLTYCFFPYWNVVDLVAWLIINWWFILLIIVDYTKYELHFPVWVITTVTALIFSIIKNPAIDIVKNTLVFVILFIIIYFLWKLVTKLKYKEWWEWFWQWDIYLAGTIWILFPFIFNFNNIDFSGLELTKLILVFMMISSILWIIYAILRNLISHTKIENSKELPFIPSMIFGFWILIFCGNLFISILW